MSDFLATLLTIGLLIYFVAGWPQPKQELTHVQNAGTVQKINEGILVSDVHTTRGSFGIGFTINAFKGDSAFIAINKDSTDYYLCTERDPRCSIYTNTESLKLEK